MSKADGPWRCGWVGLLQSVGGPNRRQTEVSRGREGFALRLLWTQLKCRLSPVSIPFTCGTRQPLLRGELVPHSEVLSLHAHTLSLSLSHTHTHTHTHTPLSGSVSRENTDERTPPLLSLPASPCSCVSSAVRPPLTFPFQWLYCSSLGVYLPLLQKRLVISQCAAGVVIVIIAPNDSFPPL